MSAPGVPSSSVSSVSSMSSVPSMPSTMPSSMPSSMSSSFSAMPYTSSMPSHSSMSSLTPAELHPMSNMSIPLSQVSPITPFTQPIATGHNVAQLRAASARRNLPQHAGANTVAFRPGSGSRGRSSSSAGRAVVAASVTKKTLIILINPISDAPDINKSHGILPALNVSLMQQDVARFVELLQHHNLAFTVEVTCDLRDPLSDDVNLHITNHLTAHRLVLPQGPSSDSSSLTAFHSRRWIVMEKSRATDGRFKLKYASSLEENEFHLSWVRVHGLKLAQPPDAYVLVVHDMEI
ncbi:hypothetical protein C8Q76DRAFT_798607 [Earliella scabrosa]|nr:hypothetical protein C8Q76DRAFT_798607 [Earliella scabrosa]